MSSRQQLLRFRRLAAPDRFGDHVTRHLAPPFGRRAPLHFEPYSTLH